MFMTLAKDGKEDLLKGGLLRYVYGLWQWGLALRGRDWRDSAGK